MKPIELAFAAVTAISQNSSRMTLVIPKGRYPKKFPKGYLLCENEQNGVVVRVYSFEPYAILAMLTKNKLIEITKGEGNKLHIKDLSAESKSEGGAA